MLRVLEKFTSRSSTSTREGDTSKAHVNNLCRAHPGKPTSNMAQLLLYKRFQHEDPLQQEAVYKMRKCIEEASEAAARGD